MKPCPRYEWCRATDRCPLTESAKANYALPEGASCPGARALATLQT
jgi:hypothetical protein